MCVCVYVRVCEFVSKLWNSACEMIVESNANKLSNENANEKDFVGGKFCEQTNLYLRLLVGSA